MKCCGYRVLFSDERFEMYLSLRINKSFVFLGEIFSNSNGTGNIIKLTGYFNGTYYC